MKCRQSHIEEYSNDSIIMRVKTNAENEVTYTFKATTGTGTYISLNEKGFADLCKMINEYQKIKEEKE